MGGVRVLLGGEGNSGCDDDVVRRLGGNGSAVRGGLGVWASDDT